MKNIEINAPQILESFRNLTKSIDNYSPIDIKTKELILIGIFTAKSAVRGIKTHTELALKHGNTKEEIISSIMYALPIVGITSVTIALEEALNTIDNIQK
jgi:alkylhydroperoxidase/carboxymuconolactone decarboxylase family protein YurZ